MKEKRTSSPDDCWAMSGTKFGCVLFELMLKKAKKVLVTTKERRDFVRNKKVALPGTVPDVTGHERVNNAVVPRTSSFRKIGTK